MMIANMQKITEEWIERSRQKPYTHQITGVTAILNKPFFMLADEMGAGKTKQVIDAAQVLFVTGQIDRVVVLAPAAVRGVWFDPEFGELKKHLWENLPSKVTELHARVRMWRNYTLISARDLPLEWIISNYDFIRSVQRLEQFKPLCTPRTLLVLDESSAVKNYRAKQTKAVLTLRRRCGRVVLLNGTPISHSPGDLYSQGNIMDPRITGCSSIMHFRARYAVMGGHGRLAGKLIVGWHNLEDLQQRFAPYVLRRLKKDCLDLPPKLPPVTLTVALSSETWKIYKSMRDDLLAWLDANTAASAPQTITRVLRLAQITSGFVGGIEDYSQEVIDSVPPSWLPFVEPPIAPENSPEQLGPTRVVGNEKLTLFLEWFAEQMDLDANLKLLVWCRFRPELSRLQEGLEKLAQYWSWPLSLGTLHGGQTRAERERSIQLLDPRTAPAGPVVVLGTPATGSMGINLSAAHMVIYVSNDYNLKTRLQSEDRVHRPGQVHPVSYFDVVATGPNGQKTIDHHVLSTLRERQDIAHMTTSAWIEVLRSD